MLSCLLIIGFNVVPVKTFFMSDLCVVWRKGTGSISGESGDVELEAKF